MKIVAIIQARMGSTRLPGKVLKDICGHPMLWHVINRVRHVEMIDEIVVATSGNVSDDSVADFCNQAGISCFRGNEDDVLDRYYRAAGWIGADVIVRITADCPLIDPVVVSKVVSEFLSSGCDYASNTVERTYPDGLDTEVFSFAVLERAWHKARLPSEREHVTPYIWNHGEIFKQCSITQEVNLSDLRWTVDEPEDLKFVRSVYDCLYRSGRIFLMNSIVKLLKRHPELMEINRGFEANEGYLRSLEKDLVVGTPEEENRGGGFDG